MSGLSRKVVISVAASSCAIGLGYGVGWAASKPSDSTADAPTVTRQILDEKQQSLADQLERDNASGLNAVGDGDGIIAGWVSTETFRAGPAASLAEVGEVYHSEGTVVGYYDTQAASSPLTSTTAARTTWQWQRRR